jgi:hypothetical protein
MVRFLEQEVDEIRDVVADIVSTMVKRKAVKRAPSPSEESAKLLAKLAEDLAGMGITTADKGPSAPKQRTVLQPEQQRVQQVMVQLQHNMLRLQQSVSEGRKDVGSERYDIGFSLGTLVRLYFGPTDLQSNPQALPEAFALALSQSYVAAGSNLQLLIDGLAGVCF